MTRFKSDADVRRAYESNGVDFRKLVEECRDFTKKVPFFENMVGSTFTAEENLTVTHMTIAGEEKSITKGPALSTLSGYWATFELAWEAIDRAIDKNSYAEFLSAVVHGIASIEGYINYRAESWNKAYPESRLVDSKEAKINLDNKIDEWIPFMTKGKKLDKGTINWESYKKLRTIRDIEAIHPKSSGYIISLIELAEKINQFGIGIAGMLIQLHLLFEEKIPAIIIRASYSPEVVVIKN